MIQSGPNVWTETCRLKSLHCVKLGFTRMQCSIHVLGFRSSAGSYSYYIIAWIQWYGRYNICKQGCGYEYCDMSQLVTPSLLLGFWFCHSLVFEPTAVIYACHNKLKYVTNTVKCFVFWTFILTNVYHSKYWPIKTWKIKIFSKVDRFLVPPVPEL